MLSGLFKIYTSPSLVNCPSHFNKNHCFLFTILHIQRKVSHQVSFQKRSALVINLLFISVNYKSFFLVSLQPWSGEYLDLKTKGIYKCVCCGSELFRYELMSKVLCKEKIQVCSILKAFSLLIFSNTAQPASLILAQDGRHFIQL